MKSNRSASANARAFSLSILNACVNNDRIGFFLHTDPYTPFVLYITLFWLLVFSPILLNSHKEFSMNTIWKVAANSRSKVPKIELKKHTL